MLAGHAARQIACDGSLSGPHPSWKRVSAAGNDGFGRRRETSRPRVTISVFALPIASERGPWGLHCALFVHSRKAFSLSLSLSFFFFYPSLVVSRQGRYNVTSCGSVVRAFVAKQRGALTGAPKRCSLQAALTRRYLLVRSFLYPCRWAKQMSPFLYSRENSNARCAGSSSIPEASLPPFLWQFATNEKKKKTKSDA